MATKVVKIPGSALDACFNTLRASKWKLLLVITFGEKLVAENEGTQCTAWRFRGKIYMGQNLIKQGVS